MNKLIAGILTAVLVFATTTTPFTACAADAVDASYRPFVPGEKVEFEIPALVGYAAKGLPSGLKFNTMTGLLTGAAAVSALRHLPIRTVRMGRSSRRASTCPPRT